MIHDSSSDDDTSGGIGSGGGGGGSTQTVYEDAVKRALAMAASLSAGGASTSSSSIVTSTRIDSDSSNRVTAKAAKKTTIADSARKRPLAKSSRPWVSKSTVMTSKSKPPPQPPRHSHSHVSSSSSHRSDGVSKEAPTAPGGRPHPGDGASRRVDGRTSHYTSSMGQGGGSLLALQPKVSKAAKVQHRRLEQQKTRPPDLIEISSSPSSSSSAESESESDRSSESSRTVRSRHSTHPRPRDRKVRRVLSPGSLVAQPTGDVKSAGEHRHDGADRHKTVHRKQTVVIGKTTEKHREREQPGGTQARGPPLPSVRPVSAKKKATRKTPVLLNLSRDARANNDMRSAAHSVSSLSSEDAVSREVHREKKHRLAQQRDRQQQQRRRRERDVDSDASLSSLSDDGSQTRYYCRKSAPISTSSAAVLRYRRVPSQSASPSPSWKQPRRQPPPPPSRSSQVQQPPKRSPPTSSCDDTPSSSKRQRRQPTARFHVDSVALDELQAQERELARFEREMRQLSSLDAGGAAAKAGSIKKTAASARAVPSENASVRRRSFSDSGDDSDVQMTEQSAVQPLPRATRKFALSTHVQGERASVTVAQQRHQPLHAKSPPGSRGPLSGVSADRTDARRMSVATSRVTSHGKQHQPQQQLKINAERAMRFLERLDPRRFVIHPTAYRGVRVVSPPATVVTEETVNCLPVLQSEFDVPLSAYGEWCIRSM